LEISIGNTKQDKPDFLAETHKMAAFQNETKVQKSFV